jgi:hypothetical protein
MVKSKPLTSVKSKTVFSVKLPTAAAISPEQSEDFTCEADFTHPQGWI